MSSVWHLPEKRQMCISPGVWSIRDGSLILRVCSFQALNILLSLSKIRYLPTARPSGGQLIWILGFAVQKLQQLSQYLGGEGGGGQTDILHYTTHYGPAGLGRLEYFLSPIRTWYPLWSSSGETAACYKSAVIMKTGRQVSTILSSPLSHSCDVKIIRKMCLVLVLLII